MSDVETMVARFQQLAVRGELEGIWPDIPIEVYNHPLFPGVRSSHLKVVRDKSFSHLTDEQSKTREEKEHFRFGTAFHERMENIPLETIAKKYSLLPSEAETIKQMRASVFSMKKFREMFEGSQTEVTFIAKCPRTGFYIRCRADLWNKEQKIFADYKTTRDASPSGFQRSCRKYAYKFSAAYYMYIASRLGVQINEFRMFAVEKEGLLLAAPYSYYNYSVEDVLGDIVRSLERYALGASGGHAGYEEEVTELRY